MAMNTPFPEFRATGDKYDIQVFIEDLTHHCVMQNRFHPSKRYRSSQWTKPDKAMACLWPGLSGRKHTSITIEIRQPFKKTAANMTNDSAMKLQFKFPSLTCIGHGVEPDPAKVAGCNHRDAKTN